MRSEAELREIVVEVIEDIVSCIDKQEVWESAQSFGYNITPEEQQAIVDKIRAAHLTVEFEN